MFAHFMDMITSRGGSRWWNTNFAENAHIGAVKTCYRAGNMQVATLQPQIAQNFERRRVVHEHARTLGVEQDHVRRPFGEWGGVGAWGGLTTGAIPSEL